MRLASLLVVLVSIVPGRALAQRLSVSEEFDPTTPGSVPRGRPLFAHHGDGLALIGPQHTSLRLLGASLGPVGDERLLPGRAVAIGSTLALVEDDTGVFRVSLADLASIDAAPVAGYGPGAAARGDDFLFARGWEAGSPLAFWPRGAPAPVDLALPCATCSIRSVACSAGACAVLLFDLTTDSSSLLRVDLSPSPRVSDAVVVSGVRLPDRVDAVAGGWALSSGSGLEGTTKLHFRDFDLAPIAEWTVPDAIASDCTLDGCFVLRRSGLIERWDARGATALVMAGIALEPWGALACTATSCLVSSYDSWRGRLFGVERASGATVDLTSRYWVSPAAQLFPQVVSTPTGFVMSLGDQRFAESGRTFAVALARPEPGVVAEPSRAGEGLWSLLAVSDAQVLVETGGLGGLTGLVRTAFDGTVLGALAMPDECQNNFAAAGDGRGFSIACSTGGMTTLGRITEDGTLSWMPEPIEGSNPVLEPGGGDVLLLRSMWAGDLTALFLHAGVPFGTDIALGPSSGYTRVAAYGAGRFLVVHSGERLRTATFVSRDGAVQPVAGPIFPAVQISVAFDGSTFLVAGLEDVGERSIFLRRLRLDGTWVEAEPRLVATFSTGPGALASVLRSADLASDGSGTALLVFPRYVPELPFATLRVHARWLTTGAPLGDACRSDEDCGSGACVRGRCCSATCDGACEACSAEGVCATFCDAGAPDAGADASSGSGTDAGVAPPRTVPGCACRAARGEPTRVPLVLVLVVCATLGRWRSAPAAR